MKQLPFGKSSGCLQAVLLMTLSYVLKAISSSIAGRRLDVPNFDSMLCSDGSNHMRTESLRGGKLREQQIACEHDAHFCCRRVLTACCRRDPRYHAAACLPQAISD